VNESQMTNSVVPSINQMIVISSVDLAASWFCGFSFVVPISHAPLSARQTRVQGVTEHLIVEIGSTIAMQIVQVVPDGRAARAGQVDVGKQDFLLVR
jgi:hypothetical protein